MIRGRTTNSLGFSRIWTRSPPMGCVRLWASRRISHGQTLAQFFTWCLFLLGFSENGISFTSLYDNDIVVTIVLFKSVSHTVSPWSTVVNCNIFYLLKMYSSLPFVTLSCNLILCQVRGCYFHWLKGRPTYLFFLIASVHT